MSATIPFAGPFFYDYTVSVGDASFHRHRTKRHAVPGLFLQALHSGGRASPGAANTAASQPDPPHLQLDGAADLNGSSASVISGRGVSPTPENPAMIGARVPVCRHLGASRNDERARPTRPTPAPWSRARSPRNSAHP